ncbi:hypothetical protein Zmor_007627 [Zophobas morio]|uniref:7tm 6 domain containing protein n=1 Tax=Zophobas morio TaxID=2755281 RepID=A0AA38MPM5_9CUCU|nr:hypothetical protein Zmor_007627 [Zophobas morio]
MQRYDWSSAIKLNLLSLRFIGLWPAGDGTYKLNLYSLYAFISIIFILGGHVLFQTVTLFFVYDKLETVASNIFITMTDILIYVKMYHIVRNVKTLNKLLDSLNEDVFQPKDERQIKIAEQSINIWSYVYKWFTFFVYVIATIWSTLPFLTGNFKKKVLPHDVWFPYDYKVSPMYELTYLFEMFGIYFVSILNVNFDTLICALLTYITAQCDLVCDNVKNVVGGHVSKQPHQVHQKIVNCIKHHKKLLSLAETVNHLFEVVIFGQFITSTVVIATTLFMLTLTDPLSLDNEGFLIALYAGAVATEIFTYCWFGNEVEIKVRIE